MLPKTPNPTTLKQLQPVCVTPLFSKILESIVRKYVIADIEPNINRKQYGVRKGVGTQNCVAELMTDLTCAADTADYT